MVVLRPRAVDADRAADFQVEPDPQEPGAFIVLGRKPERWILQTDFENDEAVGYLADRLARAGVEKALFEAGAEEGCTVTIGGISFEWEPMTTAGEDVVLTSRGTDPRLGRTTRASAAERKRASQVRRGLIDEDQYDDEAPASRERWQG